MKKLLLSVFLTLGTPLLAYAEIKIGWIGPLTGNAAVLGVDSVPAIQIAIDEINSAGGIGGEKITLIVEDDQYQASNTVRAYHKLVHAEGVRIIFTLTYGGVFAIAPMAQKDGVILVDTLDCDEKMAPLPSNTICIAKTTEALGREIAKMIIDKGDHPAAILHFDGDPFMGILADALSTCLTANGVKPVLVETYNDTQTDFRGFVARVKQKHGIKSVALLGYDQIGTAARTLREQGVSVQFYGVNTASSPGFRELAGESVEGMLGAAFFGPPSEALTSFTARFRKKMGRHWRFETSTLPSFDAMWLIANALKSGAFDQTSRRVNTELLRDALLSTKAYLGVSGSISVDSDGVTRSIGLLQARLTEGELRPLYD